MRSKPKSRGIAKKSGSRLPKRVKQPSKSTLKKRAWDAFSKFIRTNDNRIENLELTIRGKHAKEHNQGYIDGFKRGYLDGKNTATQEEAT